MIWPVSVPATLMHPHMVPGHHTDGGRPNIGATKQTRPTSCRQNRRGSKRAPARLGYAPQSAVGMRVAVCCRMAGAPVQCGGAPAWLIWAQAISCDHRAADLGCSGESIHVDSREQPRSTAQWSLATPHARVSRAVSLSHDLHQSSGQDHDHHRPHK